jgi:hypothetical protein
MVNSARYIDRALIDAALGDARSSLRLRVNE